jgi:hypothetical protein
MTTDPTSEPPADEPDWRARVLAGEFSLFGWLPGGANQSRPASSRHSAWIILLVNLIPAFGVLVLQWDAFTVVFLYWVENLIVGLVTVLKILSATGGVPKAMATSGKFFLIPFFCVHYGLFMLVHGVFIFALLGGGMRPGVNPFAVFAGVPAMGLGFALATVGFVGEHLYAFYRDYLRSGGYKKTSPVTAMFSPYGRIVVLHLSILGGAFLLVLLGLPPLMVVLLVIFKTGYEVKTAGGTRWMWTAEPK